MCKSCKLSDLGLNHDTPTDFMRPLVSSWEKVPVKFFQCPASVSMPKRARFRFQTGNRSVFYVIYRWVFAVYFVFVMVYDLSYIFEYATGKWFIIVTHWSFVTLILCTTVQAILATDYYINPPPQKMQGCKSPESSLLLGDSEQGKSFFPRVSHRIHQRIPFLT